MARRGRAPRRGQRFRFGPAAAGTLTILVLGVVALRIGALNLQAAEDARLTARRDLVTAVARNADPAVALGDLADTVTALHLDPADTGRFADRMGDFRALQGGDPVSAAVLLAPDGSVLGSSPAGATLPPGALDAVWPRARSGERARTAAFMSDGAVATAALLPVGTDTPWAVLVAVQPALRSALQTYWEGIGSQNGEPGGLVFVDAAGIAVQSWNRADVGRPVLDAAAVASLPTTATVWRDRVDGEERTRIGARVASGFGLLFEQRDGDLYGDLAAVQAQRDRTTVAVLSGALAALVVFQLSRERAARRAEARITALMENSQDVILACDGDGTIVFAGASLPRLLGPPPDAWRGRSLLDVCHPDDADALAARLAAPGEGALLDVRLAAGDGSYRWFDVETGDIRRLGQLGAVLLTCREVGDRKALQDKLTFEAAHDPLTGLMNRRRFSEHIEEHVAAGRPAVPLALLYLDLDHFKPVNDTLGHEAGDDILRIVARRLVEAAASPASVCRLGGDEFAVLLVGAGETEATALATRLIGALASPIAVMGRLATIGASIGVALAEPADRLPSPDHLIRRADQAMYAAKQMGRSAYRVAPVDSDEDADPDEREPTAPGADPAGGGPVPDALRRRADSPDDPDHWSERRAGAPGADERRPADAPVGPVDAGTGQGTMRRRLAAGVPLVVAVAVVVAIAAAGHLQSRAALRDAEDQRVVEQQVVAGYAAEYYASLGAFGRLAKLAEQMPWTLDGSVVDRVIVDGWAHSAVAGPGATSTLLTPDRRPLVVSPPGAAMNLAPTSDAWREALAGRVGFEPLVMDADQPRAYVAVPVVRDGRVRAVLVLATSDRDGTIPQIVANAGNAGEHESGWSLLNRDGRAFASWDKDLVGTAAVDPEVLEHLRAPSTEVVPDAEGDVVLVSALPGYQAGISYVAFTSPADEFFADLRTGRDARDITLAAVVLITVIALALVNLRRERAVRRSESRLDTLLANAHDVVIVLDEDGRTRYVSAAIRRLIGDWPPGPEAQPGTRHLRTADLRAPVHPDDRARLDRLDAEVRADGAATCRDIRVLDAAGRERWFDVDARDLRSHPQVRGFLLTCHDVTERKSLQDEMAFRARHDALTGLANRSALGERLEQLAGDAEPFAVLFLDLDHFKPVNDRYGHEAGDEVLRVIARRIADEVHADDLVCRQGGDEFTVVLAGADEQAARRTAERMLRAAREPIGVGGREVRVGATIGVALSGSGAGHENPERTVRDADRAMYQAKVVSRGTYALFGAGDGTGDASPAPAVDDADLR